MTYADELRRKAIHLGSSAFAIVYHYTDRELMLKLIVPLVGVGLVIETLRHFMPAVQRVVQQVLGPILRADEQRLLTGATYVAISVLLAVLIFPRPIAVTVLLFMSISDALASLVGRCVPSARFLGKSLAGSGAFLVSALLIVVWQLPTLLVVGVVGALIATVVEAIELRWGWFRLDDNLAIPLISGAAMVLLAWQLQRA